MLCQSNNATEPGPAVAPGVEAIDIPAAAERIAARWNERGVDEQVDAIRRLVPAFDAPFFQAGLAGYSDASMRLIARRHGAPFCVTEALLDRTLLAGGRGFAKADLGRLEDNVPGGEDDHPLAGQIMGSEPREMAAAAVKMIEQGRRRSEREYRRLAYDGGHVHTHAAAGAAAETPAASAAGRQHLRLPGGVQVGFWPEVDDESEPALAAAAGGAGRVATRATVQGDSDGTRSEASFEVIDVNLACPVKKIDRKARGGHWLAEPDGAIAILEAVREAVPADVPCTVKLRRAYDDTPEMAANFERIFDAAYRIGYAWCTVHARTVEQKYVGPSRWDVLRGIVGRHPGRIVFGSGDVWDAADIVRMIEYTGVHAVSVARGCIGDPWIFRRARDLLAGREPRPPTLAEQRGVLLDHFDLAMKVNEGLGIRKAEVFTGKTMRKFGIRFAAHHPRAEEVRRRFIAVASLAEWRGVVEEFYGTGGAGS